MKGRSLATLLAGLLLTSSVAWATDRPSTFDFEFSTTETPPVQIADETLQWFVINVPEQIDTVVWLEFEVAGLSHDAPMDLRIELLDPVGGGIVAMDEAGDQVAVTDLTLIFHDKGDLPPATAGVSLGPDGSTQEYGPLVGTFGAYTFLPAGEWRVVISDDDAGGAGTFTSATIRGLVPEPATLSLLAIGAIATLRYRRRR